MLKEYFKVKQKYPDAILWFRNGDEYITYKNDAKETIKSCEDVRLVGDDAVFPFYSLDKNLRIMVKLGYRVAVCDPLANTETKRKGRKQKL
jgi:DNA mismatch repair protein MutS